MLSSLYTAFLRLGGFRGKARIDERMKRAWFTAPVWSLPDGIRMRLDPLEWAQADIIRDGGIEPLTCALLRRVLRERDVYVDVGAHVGYHTLVARQCVGASGAVVAIEPQPYNADRLLENWEANGFSNLDLYVAVAGEDRRLVELRAQAVADKSRLSLVLPGVNDRKQRFHVPMVRLDEVLGRGLVGSIRLLKIDVEGYEEQVLAGLGDSIARIENMVVEVLPGASQGVLAILTAAGFSLHTVEGGIFRPGDAVPENNVWARRAAAGSPMPATGG